MLIGELLICVIRDEPEVRDLNMLHASDYGNMSFDQLERKLNERKKKDTEIQRSMR